MQQRKEIPMQRVINFSGGRTSAMMTILEYKPGDIVLFCDTGREHPKTYKFIHDFEAHEGLPVVWLKYDGGFEGLIEKKSGVPNVFKRFCTVQLKVMTARRYLVSIGIKEYENLIGFRSDELMRVRRHKERWKSVTTIFSLYEQGITKADVLSFWDLKPYNLEAPPILGNCDLCFLKGKAAIIQIMREYPELADKWIADEERGGHTYIKGISYKQMLEISQRPEMKQAGLYNLEPAFNCSCTA